ncbi:MAG: hypothetical protein ROR55_17790 [Devosia sp.]
MDHTERKFIRTSMRVAGVLTHYAFVGGRWSLERASGGWRHIRDRINKR